MSLKAGSGNRDSHVPSSIRQRAKPHLLVIDASFNIIHYERAALRLLEDLFGTAAPSRLPAAVESAVRDVLAHGFDDERAQHATVMPARSLVVHISRVHGGGGSFFALLLQRESRRAPLASAARRYALTKREREVLQLIMRGMHAADIAKQLSISQSTVTGYFKGLLRKTEARSRSEMVAKVLGWDDSDMLSPSV